MSKEIKKIRIRKKIFTTYIHNQNKHLCPEITAKNRQVKVNNPINNKMVIQNKQTFNRRRNI